VLAVFFVLVLDHHSCEPEVITDSRSTLCCPLMLREVASRTPTFAKQRLPALLLRRAFASSAECPYAVLGLGRSATSEDVKGAYRQQALEHHPDRNPHRDRAEAEAAFRRASEAYLALSGVLSPAVGSSRDQWQRELQRQCQILMRQMGGSGSAFAPPGGGSVHVGRRVLRMPDGTLLLRIETTKTNRRGEVSTDVETRRLGGRAVWGDDQAG
jgi:hypothetical protein